MILPGQVMAQRVAATVGVEEQKETQPMEQDTHDIAEAPMGHPVSRPRSPIAVDLSDEEDDVPLTYLIRTPMAQGGGGGPVIGQHDHVPMPMDQSPMPLGLKEWAFNEISRATDGFAAGNKIGKGGFGDVFRGRLDHQDVAVKVLSEEVYNSVPLKQRQAMRDMFDTEVSQRLD